MLCKVISGGQTGADQGGLMAAFRLGIETGGTCPDSWYTENGPNPLLGLLGLVPRGDLRSRTIQNVKDSTGTVLLTMTSNSPGSRLTRNECSRQHKSLLEIDTRQIIEQMATGDTTVTLSHLLHGASSTIQLWIRQHSIVVLNVAGNREKSPLLLTTRAVDTILTQALNGLIVDGLVNQEFKR